MVTLVHFPFFKIHRCARVRVVECLRRTDLNLSNLGSRGRHSEREGAEAAKSRGVVFSASYCVALKLDSPRVYRKRS